MVSLSAYLLSNFWGSSVHSPVPLFHHCLQSCPCSTVASDYRTCPCSTVSSNHRTCLCFTVVSDYHACKSMYASECHSKFFGCYHARPHSTVASDHCTLHCSSVASVFNVLHSTAATTHIIGWKAAASNTTDATYSGQSNLWCSLWFIWFVSTTTGQVH